MSTTLAFKSKSTRGTKKRARGSPVQSPRPEYGLFRACGVEVEDGEDLKACLVKTLAERPLELLSRCCDKKALAFVRRAKQCDRTEGLLELYVAMRCSGEAHRDGILAWKADICGLVNYLRRGSIFASKKLCEKEEQSPWGRTISLEEVRFASESGDDAGTATSATYLDYLAAKPEPGVCVCGRY